jgi:carboxylesterase type B
LPKYYSYSSPDGVPYDATKFREVCLQTNYSASVKKQLQHVLGEDCLRLNIWAPIRKPEEKDPKWPVMIWFHGGWFQIGEPSQEESMDPTELISTGQLNAVFVAVGYRLNVFGFLAGDALREETGGQEVGNYGLWDQRLAMEWVYKNISAFGGDPENITLSGRSAGAYAVQAQTLYDFRGSMDESARNHFRRLVMYSNAIPTQPKTPEDCQSQLDELCKFFNIALEAPGPEKLRRLRELNAEDLCAAVMKLKHHTFRPVTDGIFIHPGIFEYYCDGSFAKEFKRRHLRLLIGEVLNEETLYAVTNGPEANRESLELQVSNYYSPSTTSRLLQHYSLPDSDQKRDWEAVFGQIISDGQVRAPSRFLVHNLLQHGVDIKDVWRYLIAYRMSFITDKVAPPSFGVSHAMDRPIWK